MFRCGVNASARVVCLLHVSVVCVALVMGVDVTF